MSNQRTDTVNKVDKSRSISGTNLSNISTRIEKPTVIDIVQDNTDLSDLSLQGDDSAGIKPDIISIPRKNIRKQNSDTSIIRKQSIQ